MNCEALLKGTQVDGVYSADPKTDATATRFDSLSYTEVITKNLKVMDTSAIALSQENAVPILVFSIHNSGSFAETIQGKGTFTVVQ